MSGVAADTTTRMHAVDKGRGTAALQAFAR